MRTPLLQSRQSVGRPNTPLYYRNSDPECEQAEAVQDPLRVGDEESVGNDGFGAFNDTIRHRCCRQLVRLRCPSLSHLQNTSEMKEPDGVYCNR